METILIRDKEGKDKIIPTKESKKTFAEIFKPLHDTPKKIKEEEVVDLIHKLRKEWRKEKV